jgi:hypothetical protein
MKHVMKAAVTRIRAEVVAAGVAAAAAVVAVKAAAIQVLLVLQSRLRLDP